MSDYLFTLDSPPFRPFLGYTAAKGPLENIPTDLLLCTKSFARWHGINLRNPHARFNFFPDNKGLYIAGCFSSQLAQLTVNGEEVRRKPYHLNQHSMNIGFGKLEYVFQWTEFAATEGFKDHRSRYVTRALDSRPIVEFDMPTPLPNRRMMGKWTLGDALGAGGHGRVFFASSTSGEMAAIKLLERTPRNYCAVDAEVQVCKAVTAGAEQWDDGERVLRVVEVIYTDQESFSSKTAFDNVAIVLKPMTPQTLADWVGTRSNG
jgi:hypothetical protein